MGQPNTQQAGFRYRNDDGDETSATWMYNLDTNGEVDVDTVFRLRILLDEYAGNDETDGYELEYNHESGGWNDITTISSVVQLAASAEDGWTITDGDNEIDTVARQASRVVREVQSIAPRAPVQRGGTIPACHVKTLLPAVDA